MPHMQPSPAIAPVLPRRRFAIAPIARTIAKKSRPAYPAVADFLASLAAFSIDRKSQKISCAKNRPFPPAV